MRIIILLHVFKIYFAINKPGLINNNEKNKIVLINYLIKKSQCEEERFIKSQIFIL